MSAKKKKVKTVKDVTVVDKKSGIAMHVSMLVKMFEAGEFVLREDIEKQKKQQRRKVPKGKVDFTMSIFIDEFKLKGSINGAIDSMLKRNKDGSYLFRAVSKDLKWPKGKKKKMDLQTQEKNFLKDQVRKRYKDVSGCKLQLKLLEGIKFGDPDYHLQFGFTDEYLKKYPEMDEWFLP